MKKMLFLLAGLLALSCTARYEPTLDAQWTLTVVSLDSARTQIVIPSSEAAEPTVKHQGKRTEVTYHSVGGKDIEVRLTYAGTEKCHTVTPVVTNAEDGWAVIQLAGPEMRDLGVDVEKMRLLVPEGAGFRFDLSKVKASNGWTEKKEEKCFVYRRPYPCRHMTM